MTLAHASFLGFPFSATDESDSPVSSLGPALWLDASQRVTLDGASSRVTSWGSRVGAISAVQAVTSLMPVVASSQIGSISPIRFDGADDFMVLSNGEKLSRNVSGLTAFLVVRQNGTSGLQRILYSTTNGGGARFSVDRTSLRRDQCAYRRLDADGVNSYSTGDNAWAVNTANLVTHRIDFAAGTGLIRLDGAPSGSATLASAGSTSDTDSSNPTLGAQYGSSNPASCDVGEVLLFSRSLPTGEMQRVETYLKAKWGTP